MIKRPCPIILKERKVDSTVYSEDACGFMPRPDWVKTGSGRFGFIQSRPKINLSFLNND